MWLIAISVVVLALNYRWYRSWTAESYSVVPLEGFEEDGGWGVDMARGHTVGHYGDGALSFFVTADEEIVEHTRPEHTLVRDVKLPKLPYSRTVTPALSSPHLALERIAADSRFVVTYKLRGPSTFWSDVLDFFEDFDPEPSETPRVRAVVRADHRITLHWVCRALQIGHDEDVGELIAVGGTTRSTAPPDLPEYVA